MSKPKPIALKKLSGTVKKARENGKETVPLTIRKPKPPSGMKSKARKNFNALSDLLERMKVLQESDSLALELICEAYETWYEAKKVIRKQGLTYEVVNRDGAKLVKVRPECKIMSDAYNGICRLLSEFGLTPASRGKVGATKESVADPLSEIIKKFG